MRRGAAIALAAAVATTAYGATSSPAQAFNPLKRACRVVGVASHLVGGTCEGVADTAGTVVSAGGKLATGQAGAAAATLVSGGAALGLSAVSAWVLGGASFALHETATLVGETTAPQLATTWFSSTYWRMAGIAAVLTLPFLFAAAVQALLRSDLALLIRAALGYLPLAMLAVAIAAPLTMLLLAASDQMSAAVSSAAGDAGGRYLGRAALVLGGLSPFNGAPFLAFLVGLLTAAGAVVLWFELLMREAAVYVIVLMLPVVFAALVWPARRIWAVRAVELLVALIFSKFVIVAVLSLGGAAVSAGAAQSVAGWLAGLVILVMGAFAPWAMLRLVPLAELASSAAHSLHADRRVVEGRAALAGGMAYQGYEWAATTTAQMRRELGVAADTLRTQPMDDGATEEPEETGGADDAALETGGTDDRTPPPAGVPPEPTAASRETTAASRESARDGGAGAPASGGAKAPIPQATPEPSAGPAAPEEPWLADDRSRTLVFDSSAGLWDVGRWSRNEPTTAAPPELRPPPQLPPGPDDASEPTQDDADPLPPRQDPPDGRL